MERTGWIVLLVVIKVSALTAHTAGEGWFIRTLKHSQGVVILKGKLYFFIMKSIYLVVSEDKQ